MSSGGSGPTAGSRGSGCWPGGPGVGSSAAKGKCLFKLLGNHHGNATGCARK
jgi:hypothetical protein